jgi:hypothetical protein
VKLPIAADNSKAVVGFVGAGTAVCWHLPRFHGKSNQHLLVKSSSVSSVREMSFPAVFEVPLHHSPPSVVPSCGSRFQIERLGIEAQNYFPLAREGSPVERAIFLGTESSKGFEYSMRSGVDCLLLEVSVKRHHSEVKEPLLGRELKLVERM